MSEGTKAWARAYKANLKRQIEDGELWMEPSDEMWDELDAAHAAYVASFQAIAAKYGNTSRWYDLETYRTMRKFKWYRREAP